MDRSYQDQISSLQNEENKERCIRLFNELDPEGQEIVLEYMTYLVSKGTYIRRHYIKTTLRHADVF